MSYSVQENKRGETLVNGDRFCYYLNNFLTVKINFIYLNIIFIYVYISYININKTYVCAMYKQIEKCFQVHID